MARMQDVPIRCACGAVRGVVRDMAPSNTNRAICHCDDCQAFAHYLGQADEVLDEHGGTEVLQVAPGRVEFIEGAGHVACLRLTDSGPYRWYADCCRTPLGNTPANWRISFVGLLRRCLDADGDAALESAAGPVGMRIFTQFATGDTATMTKVPGFTAWGMFRFGLSILAGMLTGGYRHTPFFDGSGQPVAAPYRVEGAERAQLAPYARASA